jgi:predicted ATPase/DNA-binding winged helix-turn-helix (wHTH) protein
LSEDKLSDIPFSSGAQAIVTTGPELDRVITFGPYRLFPRERRLLEGDRPVRLGSRALDILLALLAHPGELVSRRDLMRIVWPDTVVAEANLSVQVAALRRALGDGDAGACYIVNIIGRGYSFTAPVTLGEALQSSEPSGAVCIRSHNLPAQLTRLVGREETVDGLVQKLATDRVLTIVGPGGVGKTAVALATAERLIGAYEDGVWLIDLAPSFDPHLVPTALASTLGLEIRSDDPLPALVAALRDKRMLLVLDNCEHVIDAAAAVSEGILKGARAVQIVATSREPLRVEGEWTHRLHGLASPPALECLSAAETLRFPAARVFVERVTAAMDEFELSDADAPSVRDICRNLEGIPLALEFAAARVDVFGVQGVAARVGDMLRLLTGGRRTAPARHKTITTVIEWSYRLLSSEDQALLRRLAIFVGGFRLESAAAMAASTDETITRIADRIASLVPKSLVAAEEVAGSIRFRVLGTTRAYALAKLGESGEADALARCHAVHFRELLQSRWNPSDPEGFVATHASELDNIRAALAWAFAPGGDASIAVALAEGSAPIWLELSLLNECHAWMAKALDILDPADRGSRRELVLQTAYGLALMFARGMSERAREALTRAAELAESVDDIDFQRRAITGLMLYRLRIGDHQGVLALALRRHGNRYACQLPPEWGAR